MLDIISMISLTFEKYRENCHLQTLHMAYSSKRYKGLLNWDTVSILLT